MTSATTAVRQAINEYFYGRSNKGLRTKLLGKVSRAETYREMLESLRATSSQVALQPHADMALAEICTIVEHAIDGRYTD